jgi:hypothetical protein
MIELQDGLPTALRDVNGTDQDDLFFCDPSIANPPIWFLTGKSMGLLYIKMTN